MNFDTCSRHYDHVIRLSLEYLGPNRLVVRTTRCGRVNPGSNPGSDNFLYEYYYQIQQYTIIYSRSNSNILVFILINNIQAYE